MAEETIRLLVVHSSAELYGSDRSLLDFVRHAPPNVKVTVALPEQGALVSELQHCGASVLVGDVCKIERSMLSPLRLLLVPVALLRAMRFLRNTQGANRYDLVYSNSLAVLGGAIFAKLWRVPHVWHVREIISSSSVLKTGFRWVVNWLSTSVVCNSDQTLAWVKTEKSALKYRRIWNGVAVPNVVSERQAVRTALGADDHDVLFVLAGRINSWKGQQLLVQAFLRLTADIRSRTRLAIVGSAHAGQEHFEVALTQLIAQSGCADRVAVFPYRTDIAPIWDACDVVLVPSTEPEPFGRVAIEAMGHGKPVIAAAHGGLTEIVVTGVTGILVQPRDPPALAEAMSALVRNADLRRRMGDAGQLRQREFFSVATYAAELTKVLLTTARCRGRTVLFVHQSPEMYGSDKVLLSIVLGVQAHGYCPIVLLPSDGPLFMTLQAEQIETHIVEVTKLSRETFSVGGVLALPFKLFTSWREINRIRGGRPIDLVYSNTLAVLGAAVYAKLKRLPHLWHVHELLTSPSMVRQGFPWLLRLLADRVICNSNMTSQWLVQEQPGLAKKITMIWNGIGPRPPVRATMAADLRSSLGVQEGELLVALVGRINRWKGHALFVNTATELWQRGFRHIHYLIVGGMAEWQEPLIDALRAQISMSPAKTHIDLLPFTTDVWNVWDACDIAVVPSTDPEPFGMVAIEAMSSGKPVLVAAHGGLSDIVEDGVSGLWFKPADVASFADQLQRLVDSPQLRETLGQAGHARQKQHFSLESQVDATIEQLDQMTTCKRPTNG